MKITRKTLLLITAGLGVFIIVYSLIREFAGIGLNEAQEKYMMDIIFIGALGLFMYNRKMASDEKKAKAAEEEEQRRIAESPDE